ncbi:MAG TPA: YncE family protein [Candidatus Acidoferrum sp.]|nr:YncE family protein [Candidatus Acidoferrum sp.]
MKKVGIFGIVSLLAIGGCLFLYNVKSHAAGSAAAASGYKVTGHIPVAGEGGWDYLVVDADARRLYLSHSTHVVVFDVDSHAVVGDIPDTQGVHGIALAPELGRGFISAGRANTVVIFDLKTFKMLGTVTTGTNPDAILYDGATKQVFAFNGRSKDATVIGAADGKVVGTIAIGGKPEFAAADGKGSVYVNLEDTSELLHIDARKLTVLHRWPLAPCKEPTGLAIDPKARRLFAVCDNEMMAVMDADSGKVVATPKTGEGADAAIFDPATNIAFSSNGESGTLTVLHQDSPDKYSLVENVVTKKGARTMALDTKTHALFLPAAEMIPPAAGQKWPTVKPGTMELLILSK